MLQRLDQAGVQWVRILWCDNGNVIRAKAAHIGLLEGGLPEGVGLSAAQQAIPVMFDAVAPGAGLGPVGEARLVPDWSTLKVLPYAPQQAAVLGDMVQEGQPWVHCPRQFLREQIGALQQMGLQVKAAYENEFFLLQSTATGYVPLDQSNYAHTSGLNQQAEFLAELTQALIHQGMQPEFCYPESGPGQYELSIAYTDALGAADRQVWFRETVRGVAQRYGYVACFLPKLFQNAAGSGCHLNLSLWQNQTPLMANPQHPSGLTDQARWFMAGILAHLPALCALTVPTPNSYRRILPSFWAGAYAAWGYDNREAALRVSRSQGQASRFELKTCDATANPYLALGAVIAAGCYGLQQKLELPAEARQDPALLSASQRQALGAVRLPSGLDQSLAALQNDAVLLGALGAERAAAYIAVKQMEHQHLSGLTLQEELALLAERY